MKCKIITAFLMLTAVFSFAQTREDIAIHIPMPIGGTSEQENYFLENFRMETEAAGYAISDSPSKADYTLKLEIKPNMVMYDDGTEEQAPPDEPQNVLELKLVRNNDNTEIVSFSFPFTDTSEMYDYNLYLLYQAMANVPLTKMTAVPDTDHWRNKWLYIRGSLDYTLVNYTADKGKDNKEYGLRPNSTGDKYEYGWKELTSTRSQQSISSIGATLGIELQFLNWMSAEAYLKLLTNDIGGSSVVPAIGLEVKFPIKPVKIFMIEPYLLVEFTTNTGSGVEGTMPIGLGGGAQLGVKGGEMGAFFVDVNYIYNLGESIHQYKNNDIDAYFNRWSLGFSAGYKIGFFNRNPD